MCVESIQCVRPCARCVQCTGAFTLPLWACSLSLSSCLRAQEACLSGLYQQAPCLWLLVAFDHHEIQGGDYCSLVCCLQGPVGCLVLPLRPQLWQDPLCLASPSHPGHSQPRGSALRV